MHFYIKTDSKSGKPVTTGKNNDCLIYMRQYAGENTAFDSNTFVISTGERIQPNLWDSNKNFPKQNQTDIIAIISGLRTDAITKLQDDKVKKVVTTTASLREHLNPKQIEVESQPDTLLSLWNERLRTKTKTDRTMKHRDPEVSSRNTFDRWLTYEEQLWIKDLMDVEVPLANKNRHNIANYPKEFTKEMFDMFMSYITNVEAKSTNTMKGTAGHFKTLCGWILEKKNGLRVGFYFEKIDAAQEGPRKGKLALTLEHVVKIVDLKVEPRLQYIKDMFLVQIYVGCRISDLFRIAGLVNRFNGVLDMEMTKRTKDKGKRMKQDVSPLAMDIFKEYDFNTPKIDWTEYTDGIREIIRMVDPNWKIQIRDGNKFEYKFVWEVFGSHDCIRTCVLIANQTGMPTSSIARNVGKTEATLINRYLATEDKASRGDWKLYHERLLSGIAASKKVGKAVKAKKVK